MKNEITWAFVIGLHVAAAVTAGGCQPSLGVACGRGWCSYEEICVDPQAAKPLCARDTCGNGLVDPAEECDDGNNTGGDGCSPNCMKERCGDGIMQSGEQCDDGNTVGGDGCSASCTTEVEPCGNGTPDPGEQCDDGNTAGGDGCSSSCMIEACGNGIKDLYEQCDGNTTNGDGCSAYCTVELPRDKSCITDTDCAPAGICGSGLCRVAHDCAEIKSHHPGSMDGVYSIAPGTTAPFGVVCDMKRDGGGWTLLLKATGDRTLGYDSPLWIDDSLLNAADLNIGPGNAKYQSFLSLPVTILRGELDGFLYTKDFAGKTAQQTAQQIFNGPSDTVGYFPTFNLVDPHWSTQSNCQTFGVNTPFEFARTRFGWSANNEQTCLTNDTAIGLGLMLQDFGLWGAGYECLFGGCSHGATLAGGNGRLWAK